MRVEDAHAMLEESWNYPTSREISFKAHRTSHPVYGQAGQCELQQTSCIPTELRASIESAPIFYETFSQTQYRRLL